ncbi:MAG: L-fucose:H+ symporter permease [bacterium]
MAITGGVKTNIVSTQKTQKDYTFPLTALTSLFFMWGFLTCLNDILIPHLKNVFNLNYTESMLIQFVFFTAYFICSMPSGWLVKKFGYKKGIVLGLVIAGVGCLFFYPSAAFRSYPFFLTALFIMASGITLLQVAANPYVTILGKPETASSRLNLTQAFNSLGTTIAPYFGSLLILSVTVKTADEISQLPLADLSAYQLAEAAAVQVPYLGLAAAMFIIAAIFAYIKLPEFNNSTTETSMPEENTLDHLHNSAWKYRHVTLGAIAIFVYVGGEVAIGSFLVNYLGLKEIAGLPEVDAGKLVSFYWGGAMIGRFLGSAIQRVIKPGNMLGFNAIVAAILLIVSMLTNGQVAMWTILAIGLFNSIMFPTIFSLGVAGLGKHTSQASGIMITGIVGGAIIPVLQGTIADSFVGLHHAFILPVLCYLFIAFYGFKGHIPIIKKA